MNHDTKTMRATLLAAQIYRDFTAWLAIDSDRLVAAAELLGGDAWETRASGVAYEIAHGARPEEVEADLDALYRLLTLEPTDDLESIEAFRFMSVHPDDPRADDARLCAEALQRSLDTLRRLSAAEMREVA